MHGRYSVLAHYLKVSLKNSRLLKIPKLHPQIGVCYFFRMEGIRTMKSDLPVAGRAASSQTGRSSVFGAAENADESLPLRHEKSHFCLPTKVTFFNDIRSLARTGDISSI